MKKKIKNLNILNANVIKILACIFMLLDHIGVYIYPGVLGFRYLGRLAFPLFAFFIAEGCKYTKHKLKRFLLIFVCAILCELTFNGWFGILKGNILLTFTLSISLIYAYQYLVTKLKDNKIENIDKITYTIFFIFLIVVVMIINQLFYLDYGFFGILTPLSVYAFDLENYGVKSKYNYLLKLLGLFICLSLITISYGTIQLFSFLAILILLSYNNQKGKMNIKYLFYIFYPLHLLVLYLIACI